MASSRTSPVSCCESCHIAVDFSAAPPFSESDPYITRLRLRGSVPGADRSSIGPSDERYVSPPLLRTPNHSNCELQCVASERNGYDGTSCASLAPFTLLLPSPHRPLCRPFPSRLVSYASEDPMLVRCMAA
mmetsp:Transcript_27650/g.84280  ORF Transcript_27650/g.84280 Transcript_27650/m.84280 type:complete len:131 (+) Transcript_27650:1080-1472(+)